MPRDTRAQDPLWYKDAVIYSLHVKTFFDANGDGIGDFVGLTQKLDYLQGLGITCLWLLPFYESPLRDDGYDIAHYERVDPRFGTLDDFARFIDEAHRRELRVITELVINHTSDRHPWFQAARRAPATSSKRNFYVWSDTTERYRDARVIFHDVEQSNWAWDPQARAFYWHRFFHHQPDLNFDNPRVRRAVLKAMRFWLDQGVDGLRLDAVPYLFEREGTNCENLPATHAFVKQIRAEMDRHYSHRVLLAEANQMPDEVRQYFSGGDECHMAFHFPLMPRLFMALRTEEARPIIDIIQQTTDIPATCQWAVFLRNHDELTLSAVTEEEHQFLINAYGADPSARLNRGIRRRLTPLLDNERSRLQLAYSLLLSLPGTPVLYYGDEIGMGDNIQLGDRDGVRTPMQWSDDRNGGFSAASSTRMVLPVNDDPVYGYRVVNVESQDKSPDSFLTWLKRLLVVRRRHRVFGRGEIEFLPSGNPGVLAFARRDDDDIVVVAANLTRSAQAAAIQCRTTDAGLMAIEMLDNVPFPIVGQTPYIVTLGPHGCYWIRLVARSAERPRPEAIRSTWQSERQPFEAA